MADYRDDAWQLEIVSDLTDIDHDMAVIDIPIGLPENGIRACDRAARTTLAPERHYSVFSCPVRPAVYAGSYKQACDINEQRTGNRISKQAWNICPKIKEADKYDGKMNLIESHPEVLFHSVDQEAVKHSKMTEKGRNQRKSILAEFGSIDDLEDRMASMECSLDDCLDAMILAVAADRRTMPLSTADISGEETGQIHVFSERR
ncbi:MAG: DUF429 domain-containing protein [Candidatus Nanohaloarchaeota archaeon QJJ-5]|nr:DUF429 domain-containing protein [Candidatus Nanohaloarchaeota archaeon QJJ-5]